MRLRRRQVVSKYGGADMPGEFDQYGNSEIPQGLLKNLRQHQLDLDNEDFSTITYKKNNRNFMMPPGLDPVQRKIEDYYETQVMNDNSKNNINLQKLLSHQSNINNMEYIGGRKRVVHRRRRGGNFIGGAAHKLTDAEALEAYMKRKGTDVGFELHLEKLKEARKRRKGIKAPRAKKVKYVEYYTKRKPATVRNAPMSRKKIPTAAQLRAAEAAVTRIHNKLQTHRPDTKIYQITGQRLQRALVKEQKYREARAHIINKGAGYNDILYDDEDVSRYNHNDYNM